VQAVGRSIGGARVVLALSVSWCVCAGQKFECGSLLAGGRA